ncbi:PAS domain S-box protein [Pseudomonas zhanjiangensis]|uniref:histidine kinase n=1 Tax=Pseudomonas zhanjiangensis TaxID=3239015 RepID=A0ABV3YYM2_9PSED
MNTSTRSLIAISYLYALTFALLGLSILALLGFYSTEQPSPYNVVMLPDSALGFLFAGLCLLGATRGLRRLCLSSAGLLLGLGLYSLVHNAWDAKDGLGLSLLSSFMRITDGQALLYCMLAVGLSCTANFRASRLLRQGIGVAVITLAATSIMASWWPALEDFRLSARYLNHNLNNLFFILMGVATVILSQLGAANASKTNVQGLAPSAIGIGLTCLAWYLLTLQDLKSVQQLAEQYLEKSAYRLEPLLREHRQQLEHIVYDWPKLRSSDNWMQLQIGSHLRAHPELALFVLLDSDLQVLSPSPRTSSARGEPERLLAEPAVRDWLLEMLRQPASAVHISISPVSTAGSQDMLLAMPLYRLRQPPRLLLSVLRIENRPYSEGGDFWFELVNRPSATSTINTAQESPLERPIGVRRLDLGTGDEWGLRLYLQNPQDVYIMSYLPAFVMLLGVGLGCALILSKLLANLAGEGNFLLQQTNTRLSSSLQRQQQLQMLNERIMQHSVDMLCSLDQQGRFTHVSAACTALLGYAPEELIGRNFIEFVVPEDRRRARATSQALQDGVAIIGYRNRYRRKDGSTVHVRWSSVWVEAERSTFAVGHDISDLVRQEAYAKNQRAILRMISTDQPLTDILDAICRMAEAYEPGTSCSILRASNTGGLRLIAAPSLPKAFIQQFEKHLAQPEARACSAALLTHQQGAIADIASDPRCQSCRDVALAHGLKACRSSPLLSRDDETLGSLILYQRNPMAPDCDQQQLLVTAAQLATLAVERERDHRSLQQSQQRFRSLYSFTPSAILSLDLAGRIESINASAIQLFGVSEARLQGRMGAELLAAEGRDDAEQHFKAACSGEARRFECSSKSLSGDVLELELTYLPIKIDGRITGVFAIAYDVGKRNQMTRDLRQALCHSEHQALLLSDLNTVALSMNRYPERQALLDYLAVQLRTLIGAHQSAISLRQGEGLRQWLMAFSLSDKYAAWRDYQTPANGNGIYRLICENNQPMLLTQEQLQAHPEWRGFSDEASRHPPMRGWLAVPLKSNDGENLGLLQLSDKYDDEFNEDDLAIAQQFAQMSVAALENLRLIQEVREAEQRLQAQLNFTMAITNSVGEGLIAIDGNGLVTFVNPQAAELLDSTIEALQGQRLPSLMPISLPVSRLDDQAESLAQGTCALEQDGTCRHIAYAITSLLHDQQPSGWVLAFRDISLQAQAERSLQERDQLFTLSLELFCLLDSQGHVLQVNPAFIAVLGYPAEAVVGHSCLNVIDPQDHVRLQESLIRLRTGQPLSDLEIRAIDVQGQVLWLQISAALSDDQIVYCAARDITERKATEQRLRTTLTELQRSNNELQEFAYVASHDLQEPLRKIQSFSERLITNSNDMNEQSRDYLQRMRSAAERMQALIRDLLSYSRVGSRHQPLVAVDLDRILDEVLRDMEVTLEGSQAIIQRAPLPPLLGDASQLRQLLQNLLTNAVKFRQPGQAPHIRVYAEQDGAMMWTLCIEDQGIGFDEKYLDRIFAPFQRLHARQTYPGTGIGLAIVKKIVDRHQAQITAHSRPGRGSTFRITFPALQIDATNLGRNL